jgi:hypothetical protein
VPKFLCDECVLLERFVVIVIVAVVIAVVIDVTFVAITAKDKVNNKLNQSNKLTHFTNI